MDLFHNDVKRDLQDDTQNLIGSETRFQANQISYNITFFAFHVKGLFNLYLKIVQRPADIFNIHVWFKRNPPTAGKPRKTSA